MLLVPASWPFIGVSVVCKVEENRLSLFFRGQAVIAVLFFSGGGGGGGVGIVRTLMGWL